MKAITIKQPFATLIAEGMKQYEFRTWKTKYRGKILIHAGKSVDKEALKKYEHLNLDYPSGSIIAVAELADCVLIDSEARKMLEKKNPIVYSNVIQNKDWKGYGFQLKNIEKVRSIKATGKLSLWDYDGLEDLKKIEE